MILFCSRKNRIGGDTIARICVCVKPGGANAYVDVSLCPAHAPWPWVGANPVTSLSRLKIDLKARGGPTVREIHAPLLEKGCRIDLARKGK